MTIRLALLILPVIAPGVPDVKTTAKQTKPQIKHFRYVNPEWTGHCTYVLSGRNAVPVAVDGSQADRHAYEAYCCLDADIEIPNELGNIVLVGYIDPKPVSLNSGPKDNMTGNPRGSVAYRFVMKTWYLPTPFMSIVKETDEVGVKRRYTKRRTLARNDFNTPFAWRRKFDWRAADFHPERFVHRIDLVQIPFERMKFHSKPVSLQMIRSAGWIP
jgi:hypothetical protein